MRLNFADRKEVFPCVRRMLPQDYGILFLRVSNIFNVRFIPNQFLQLLGKLAELTASNISL